MGFCAALKGNDRVYILVNSVGFIDDYKQKSLNKRNQTVVKLKGVNNTFIGASNGKKGALLNNLQTRNLVGPFKRKLSYPFIINKFVPRLFKLKEKTRYGSQKNETEFVTDFLLCTNEKIYRICDDGYVFDYDSFGAIGDGDNEIMSLFYLTQDIKDPKLRMKKICKGLMSDFNIFDYPFYLIDTLTMEYELINEEDL